MSTPICDFVRRYAGGGDKVGKAAKIKEKSYR